MDNPALDAQTQVKPEFKVDAHTCNLVDNEEIWTATVSSNMCADFEVKVVGVTIDRDEDAPGRHVSFEAALLEVDGSNLEDENAGFQHVDFWFDEFAEQVLENEKLLD